MRKKYFRLLLFHSNITFSRMCNLHKCIYEYVQERLDQRLFFQLFVVVVISVVYMCSCISCIALCVCVCVFCKSCNYLIIICIVIVLHTHIYICIYIFVPCIAHFAPLLLLLLFRNSICRMWCGVEGVWQGSKGRGGPRGRDIVVCLTRCDNSIFFCCSPLSLSLLLSASSFVSLSLVTFV